MLREDDPVALKAGYRGLFREIVVGEPDEYGKGQLKFVLHDGAETRSGITAAEKYSVRGRRVAKGGVEPPTCGL